MPGLDPGTRCSSVSDYFSMTYSGTDGRIMSGHDDAESRQCVNFNAGWYNRVEMRPAVLVSLGLGASVVKNLAVFQTDGRCHITAHPKPHGDVTPKPPFTR